MKSVQHELANVDKNGVAQFYILFPKGKNSRWCDFCWGVCLRLEGTGDLGHAIN